MDKILYTMRHKLNNEIVVIACSTGVDSMVLLDLVMKILPSSNIIIAHVNHGKREESKIEEEFIKDFSTKHNIKCYVKKLAKINDGNFQMIARNKRYEFFFDVAKKENAKYILLAHHADDNLETIIMRLLKSSSIKGYAGIEEESNYKDTIIYRPLLKKSKQEIKYYATLNNITYFEDSSNSELDYTRNRIRHLITPILLEENPSLYSAINYYSETILNASQILEKEELNFIENKILVNNNNGLTYILKQDDYYNLTDYMKKQILFRLLKKYNLSHQCIEEIMKKLSSSKTNIVTKINNTISLIKEYKTIIFTEENIEPLEYYKVIEEEGIYNLPNNTKIEVNKNNCNFITSNTKLCYNMKSLPIIVRTRKVGDKLDHKLVSDIITSNKIPYLDKKDILLLCDDLNNVITILGLKGGKKWQK